ncbi:MAG: MaoC family dehydratase, partial [Rhizobiaceae bacterium]|nr:MaoC family dehydratase [Rhizobiaceae bacterium]
MTTALFFSTPAEAAAAVGRQVGPSEWLTVEQDRIDLFARATGDHQWIHVDPERAKDGPFGRTIAHGYLTFSLINMFLPQLFEAKGARMGVNYGAERLRFPAPVPV